MLDLEILKRISRDRLIRNLEELPGAKDLVIDGDLMKILDRIADVKVLRSHGAKGIFRFEANPPTVVENQLMYIVKPTLINIKHITNHYASLSLEDDYRVHVVCVPRILSSVNLLLEEEGLHGIINIQEFCPEFIPLDVDMLTLESYNFFRDVFLDGDYAECFSIAKCLQTLQNLYGTFCNIFAHGRAAKSVMKMFDFLTQDERSRLAENSSAASNNKTEIGHVLIFDRDADFLTPLLTQLTYEGAVDEHFGIKAGIVDLPKDIVGDDQPTKVILNNKDPVFEGIRNRHFAGVSGYLVRKARDIQDKKKETSSMSAQEMKSFVKDDLKQIQDTQRGLSLHLSICEAITNKTRKDFDTQLVVEHGLVTGAKSFTESKVYVEDCIARQLPVTLNLKMLCLVSLTQSGLTVRDYESFAAQLLSAHGHQHLITLYNLRQIGILDVEENDIDANSTASGGQALLKQVVSTLGVKRSGQWRATTKKLNLIPDAEEHIDLHNPTHMSYVFNGAYIPLIPKLVSDILTKGYSSVSDALKLLTGETVACLNVNKDLILPRVAIVLVLGGVTSSEIAVLRLLSIKLSVSIIIASTCVITGERLIKSILS